MAVRGGAQSVHSKQAGKSANLDDLLAKNAMKLSQNLSVRATLNNAVQKEDDKYFSKQVYAFFTNEKNIPACYKQQAERCLADDTRNLLALGNPEEQRPDQLLLDTDRAVRAMQLSGLDRDILKMIWQRVSRTSSDGRLCKFEFYIALALISVHQHRWYVRALEELLTYPSLPEPVLTIAEQPSVSATSPGRVRAETAPVFSSTAAKQEELVDFGGFQAGASSEQQPDLLDLQHQDPYAALRELNVATSNASQSVREAIRDYRVVRTPTPSPSTGESQSASDWSASASASGSADPSRLTSPASYLPDNSDWGAFASAALSSVASNSTDNRKSDWRKLDDVPRRSSADACSNKNASSLLDMDWTTTGPNVTDTDEFDDFRAAFPPSETVSSSTFAADIPTLSHTTSSLSDAKTSYEVETFDLGTTAGDFDENYNDTYSKASRLQSDEERRFAIWLACIAVVETCVAQVHSAVEQVHDEATLRQLCALQRFQVTWSDLQAIHRVALRIRLSVAACRFQSNCSLQDSAENAIEKLEVVWKSLLKRCKSIELEQQSDEYFTETGQSCAVCCQPVCLSDTHAHSVTRGEHVYHLECANVYLQQSANQTLPYSDC